MSVGGGVFYERDTPVALSELAPHAQVKLERHVPTLLEMRSLSKVRHEGVGGAGCRVQDARCRVQGAGCRVQGLECRVFGSAFKV
jgi:hypothetical protein